MEDSQTPFNRSVIIQSQDEVKIQKKKRKHCEIFKGKKNEFERIEGCNKQRLETRLSKGKNEI